MRLINKSLAVLTATALVMTSFSNAFADDDHYKGWTRSFEEAKELAAKDGKAILMEFTGSDWCPPCKALHKNVLVMDYLGDETSPFPKLREVKVEEPQPVYDELLEFLAVSWQKANLVHGDLSAYNILWHEGEAIVIDVGQGVVQNHPRSEEFLVRDVKQLVRWANSNGIDVELAEAMYDVLEMDLDEEE